MAPPASARLFSESQPSPPSGVSVANIDGASRGNPGPASYAVVIRDPSGEIILELAKKLGRRNVSIAIDNLERAIRRWQNLKNFHSHKLNSTARSS